MGHPVSQVLQRRSKEAGNLVLFRFSFSDAVPTKSATEFSSTLTGETRPPSIGHEKAPQPTRGLVRPFANLCRDWASADMLYPLAILLGPVIDLLVGVARDPLLTWGTAALATAANVAPVERRQSGLLAPFAAAIRCRSSRRIPRCSRQPPIAAGSGSGWSGRTGSSPRPEALEPGRKHEIRDQHVADL